ncbi:hypothetical protein E1I18_00330 [Mycoplasmopsis mucosicanis]|uniref:Uncharacterized protein n=1 Tax=Mycoplasmopsis mucosicanis TaxID=458208 RepID=A0A507SR00_9BACT|nr:P80 family lipoprotein [Mycoplasmopsis mucosicanis]TQC54209.1 hypothetical protein E1I18_00330 [Mycoplasmopsis mucosicanis]
MKNNKFLTTMVSIAGAAGTLLPLVAVSCSKYKRDKIKFGVTFSRGKDQWNALTDVINKFNEHTRAEQTRLDNLIKELGEKIKTEKNKEEASKLKAQLEKAKVDRLQTLEVDLTQLGSGYGAGHEKIVTDLKNKNVSSIPNITVNYGSTLSEIVNYGKSVNIADAEKFGDLAVSRDKFDPRFTVVNDQVAGLKEGGFYSVPIFKSTQVFGINGPIYKYLFTTLKNAGYTLDDKIKTDFKVEGTDWNADIETLKGETYLGAAISSDEIKKIFTEDKYAGKTIKASIFEEFQSFVKFITDAIQIFPKAKDNGVALLGIDDAFGTLNTIAYSKLNGKNSEMLISVGTDENGVIKVGYNKINDSASEGYKAYKELIELVFSAMGQGAIKVYGGGSYGSQDEVNHKLGANIGSSAGYTHNFIEEDDIKPEIIFGAGDKKRTIERDDIGKVVEVLNEKTSKKEKKLRFKHSNVFIKSSGSTKASYYWQTDVANDGLIDKLNALELGKRYIFQVDKPGDKADDVQKTKYSELSAYLSKHLDRFEKLGEIKMVSKTKTEVKELWKFKELNVQQFEQKDVLKINIPSTATSLQDTELVVYKTPSKFDSASQKSVTFLQGPNMVLIDNGHDQNVATMKFINFMLQNSEQEFSKKGGKDKKPVKEKILTHISKTASYVVPYAGFDKDITGDSKIYEYKNDYDQIKTNTYLKVAFEALSNKDNSVTYYEEPASKYADPFRKSFNSALRAASDIFVNGNDYPFSDLVKALVRTTTNFK